jgi:hypothetical protein
MTALEINDSSHGVLDPLFRGTPYGGSQYSDEDDRRVEVWKLLARWTQWAADLREVAAGWGAPSDTTNN